VHEQQTCDIVKLMNGSVPSGISSPLQSVNIIPLLNQLLDGRSYDNLFDIHIFSFPRFSD